MAVEAGLVSEATSIVTTVHDVQVAEPGELPMTSHDIPLDLIVTPERTIRCDRAYERPADLLWDRLSEEKIRSIPFLRNRRGG